ncbi:hypothetical protein GGR56DRAFT_680575 [Xylariaceae sp. FL0804]|nr:hypothetical protein GGR56DRAFT_680575 [Xylariaceae sp. FL0804]
MSSTAASTATDQSRPSQRPSTTSPPKKSTRSQSPRAKERRRLQNRIAQRNHRRKLREQAACSEGSLTTEEQGDDFFAHSRASSPGSLSHHPSPLLSGLSGPMDDSFLHDGLAADGTTAWPPLDPSMVLPLTNGIDPSMPHFSGFMPMAQECTCNGVTGPCNIHMDEFRDRLAGLMTAPPSLESSPQPPGAAFMPHCAEDGMLMPPLPFETASASPELCDIQEFRTHARSHTAPYPRSYSSGGGGGGVRSRSHSLQRASLPPRKRSAPVGMSSTTSPYLSPASMAAAAAATTTSHPTIEGGAGDGETPAETAANTARFNAVLDYARSAGFADFDSMVGAYYTSRFQRNSLAEMSQRASRGRRLPKLLQELSEGSAQWSKWDSRSFREGVMESARSICGTEMERLSRDRNWSHERYEMPIFDGMTPDDDSVMSNDGGSPALLPSSGSSTLTHMTVPDDMGTVLQDEAPSLWSLLTELAGTEGLHCDRVSQSVLEILIRARRGQNLDLDPFLTV